MNSAARRFETVLNRIGEYSRRLGRVPASIYALGFAALILVFAPFYWFVAWLPPGHAFWYSSGAAARCADNEASVVSDLRTEIRAAYRASGAADEVINGWRMLPDRLEVDYLDSRPPLSFSFQLSMPFNSGTPEAPGNDATVSETVRVNLEDLRLRDDVVYLSFWTPSSSAEAVVGLPTAIPGPGAESVNGTQGLPPGTFTPPSLLGSTGDNVLPLSLDLYNRIIELGRTQACKAAADIPTGPTSNGTYAQMLRLSALAASLLPLADVTPGSALAYVTIWSERILGAILLALILNSLAYDIAKTRRTGLGNEEPDQPAHRSVSKRPVRRTAKGPRGAAAKKGAATAKARNAAQASAPKRAWWTSILWLARRGCILVVAGAAVLLTLAVLYAAGIYLWSMAQYESSRSRPAVPASPSASLTVTATPSATGTPTARLTPRPFGTLETTTPPVVQSPLPTTVPYPTAKTVQGDVIAFTATDLQYGKALWVANLDGSGEKRLVENIEKVMGSPGIYSMWLRGVMWSPDGKWISYDTDNGLWLVAPDGAGPRNILGLPGPYAGGAVLASWSWSPDGSRIAYALTPSQTNSGLRQASIGIIDVQSGRAHRLGDFDYGYSLSLAWTPDGRGLWLNSPGGPLRLVDPGSGSILRQPPHLDPSCSTGHIDWQIWSPNGRWFAVVEDRSGGGSNWLCIYGRDGQPVSPAGRTINSPGVPSWDAAGNALYFVSGPADQSMEAGGDQHLMRLDAGTGRAESLLTLPADAGCAWEVSLSPDDHTLEGHCRTESSKQSFLLIDVQGLKTQRYTVDLELMAGSRWSLLTQWSSDSQNIVFTAFVPARSGATLGQGPLWYGFYALDTRTGRVRPVSGWHNGFREWALSPIQVKP